MNWYHIKHTIKVIASHDAALFQQTSKYTVVYVQIAFKNEFRKDWYFSSLHILLHAIWSDRNKRTSFVWRIRNNCEIHFTRSALQEWRITIFGCGFYLVILYAAVIYQLIKLKVTSTPAVSRCFFFLFN